MQPSGGTSASIVTGSEEKPLSVPVKLNSAGRQYQGSKAIPLNQTFSMSWFKGEPQFEMGTFQVIFDILYILKVKLNFRDIINDKKNHVPSIDCRTLSNFRKKIF